jgi:hypothetical protein
MSAGRFAGRSSAARTGALALESDLIMRLRSLPVGPRPDPAFRAELRSQLVSITARIVAESATEASAVAGRGARLAAQSSRRARVGVLSALRRPLLTFASAAAVLVILLGVAVWMSSSSLPGDSLYGVKRASENVRLSLAGSDAEKGRTYLDLARNRVNEAIDLLGRPNALAGSGALAAGAVNAHTAKLVTQTLGSADSDSRSGMQLLGKSAVANMSADPLSKLDTWLPEQSSLLADVLARVPAGALHDRAQTSVNLLQRVSRRTDALKKNIGCPCLSQAVSDDLGPVPCTPCKSLNRPSAPGGQQSGAPGSVPSGLPGTGSTPSAGVPGQSVGGGQVSASASNGSQPPGSSVGLPSPSAPISAGTGGVGASVPSLGVSAGVGTSGISASLPLPLPSIKIPKLLDLN